MSIRSALPRPDILLRQALALGIGFVSAWVALRISLPLPWMLGPLIGCTLAAILGAPLAGPTQLRMVVIPVIGVLLGSAITMEVLRSMIGWWPAFLTLAPFLLAALAGSYLVFRRVGGFDPATSFFSAMPGGLNDAMLLGASAGGDERRIALAHATRILVVVFLIPLFFSIVYGATGSSGGGGARFVALGALRPVDWAFLTAAAAAGYWGGKWLDLPAYAVMGPMITSGALHAAGVVETAPPTQIVNFAQLVIGTVIGCRFLGTTLREVGRELAVGSVSAGVMILIALVFAVPAAALMGMPLTQAFLAYSPGGLAEMSLLALSMGEDLAFVSVMHLTRIALVVAMARPVWRLVQRWTAKRKG
ncbi:AbrB family transcriptional regulator [Pseudoroseicyclus tamaricis]|uniref:AbrB family transcriptional regulator n=1 Tax=Pseudoroseicyclus tamaricis TaxID=2705421 RepID=A0A6B2JEP4_9RHOB|nr:AbrB family transcriptional regulator [Pseudoroseicyclus tamaricis]NDU99362.1 AbrB family transcriptional regulator [Pseudoroseicyclus tamaricis]